MITYIDLLKNEGLGSENAPEYLKIIDDKTNRLKQLTDDLFEAAKATSGDMKVELEELDFREFVNQSLAEMGDIITESGNPVIVNDRLKDTHVMADGKMLWRVMENIFTNVAKYAAEGTRVYVDLYEKDRCNIIEVKNVSKDQLNITTDELMERFTRGDDSRSTEGSGLGLAIARELSALMGGRFDIEIDGDLFKAKVILPKGGTGLTRA